MAATGIFTQPAASVLADVEEFYTGGVLPWFHGVRFNDDRTGVLVTLSDPDGENLDAETRTYELSASQIKDAFVTAKTQGYHLCCAEDIFAEQLGLGCIQDLDMILQTACYGEPIFG